MKLSNEKDSEYKNLQTLMSKLERWTHQLYPKYRMETSLAKIESLGSKGLVRNTLRRIRTNEITDELDGMGMPEVVARRGDDEDSQDTFDAVVKEHFANYMSLNKHVIRVLKDVILQSIITFEVD